MKHRCGPRWRQVRRLALGVGLALLCLQSPWLAPIGRTESLAQTGDKTETVFVVNSTDDPGDGACTPAHCTLREAITQANATPASDTVTFNVPGAGTPVFHPASALPAITAPIILDGSTQPGGAVEINGINAGDFVDGLTLSGGDSTLRGLVINRFAGNGISISQRGGNTLVGNHVGTDVSGQTALPNGGSGILIDNVPNNTIGGTTAGAGNLISGNGMAGVLIFDEAAVGNVVQGNRIGTNQAGTAALANGDDGIVILFAGGNTIGGAAAAARNIISGNAGSGIYIYQTFAAGNTVQGNFIGVDGSGSAALGNDYEGVLLLDASQNMIGGTTPGAGNLIAANGASGVRILASSEVAASNTVQGNTIGTNAAGAQALGNRQDGVRIIRATDTRIGGETAGAANIIALNGAHGVHVEEGAGNLIRRNAIVSNGQLGIELGDDGVTANDSGDPDVGPNALQNYPTLASATPGSGTVTVSGALNSLANTTFTVEFFVSDSCDASGSGEGQTFLGDLTVTTDGAGNAALTANLPLAQLRGQALTATATAPTGDTSEFSPCLTLPNTGGEYRLYLPLLMRRAAHP